MLVTAAVATGPQRAFVRTELELDEPRAGEVRVRLVATGVCHTDAKVRDRMAPGARPIVLGHEGAGVVEALGPVGDGVSAPQLAVGDHVVLSFDHCGACRHCRAGFPSYCVEYDARNFGGARADGSTAFRLDGAPVGSHFFGQSSFADRTNAALASVIPVPRDLPFELLAPLGCGVLTGAGAVWHALEAQPGSSFAAFGAGAVGLSAVMAAVVAGCDTIIAVDRHPTRLELAAELGATHIVDTSQEDAEARILDLTRGGVDRALDTTGVPAVFTTMLRSLGIRGRAAGVAGAPSVDFPTQHLLLRGAGATMLVQGDARPREIVPRLMQLWQAGRFPLERLVRTYPVAAINDAVADSASGATIKPVLVR
ncbi:MAG TPA: NAD(P)-dependent alcohol dehydrogenase [Microbacteriaceae bacterium]|nr:NAD(P)-dependent alcohol dehydrogenase [Microbacteriaceae bacterium]